MKPGPPLFIFVFSWLVLAVTAYFLPFLLIVWIYSGLALFFLASADFLLLFFLCERFEVIREVPSSLSQGGATKVKLIISRSDSSTSGRHVFRPGFFFIPFNIQLFDLYPLSMSTSVSTGTGTSIFPASIKRSLFSKGKSFAVFEYTIYPLERGAWFFLGTELLLSSPCLFWKLKVKHTCESNGKTYPDFNKIKAGADLRGLLEKTGVKNIRRRGQGLEFMSLRDYQDGDSIRDIDWRAVSRRRSMDGNYKLIVRDYQEEQDQQVLFLLDTGYRLHKTELSSTAAGGTGALRSQFDSALEAILLLSWVSLKHGYSVAAASFGKTTRWLFPGKGMSAFPQLMNGLYDLKSSAAPSSPLACLEEALGILKRRSFIILISNFREEDGESLSWILKRVQRKHLLLLVSLRENDAESLAWRNPVNADEALETAAAFSYLVSRRDLYKSWERMGLLTLETSSQTLSPALINRYLQVKRSGRL